MINLFKPLRFQTLSPTFFQVALSCLLVLALLSCQESPTTSDQWIRSRNNKVINSARLVIEETGNKEADLKILEDMKRFRDTLSMLIESVSKNNQQAILESINIHLDSLRRDYYMPSPSFEQYFIIDEHSSLNEYKIQLALLESETFNLLTTKIGANDFKFDKLDLYFIPDQFHDNQSQRIKGKVLFALTSTMIDKHAKMFINEREIDLIDGYGIVDLSRSELSKNNSIEVTFKSDIPRTTITRELQIIPN